MGKGSVERLRAAFLSRGKFKFKIKAGKQRILLSTLDDIAKDASGTDKKVKLETRESVLELAWTASLLVEMHRTK